MREKLKWEIISFIYGKETGNLEECLKDCPLCNNHPSDYRSMLDKDIQEIYEEVMEDYKKLNIFPVELGLPYYVGLDCIATWRERWERNV